MFLTYCLFRAIFVPMRVSLKIFFPVLFILHLTTALVFAQTGAINADPDFDNYNADPAGPWQTFKISNPGPKIWRTEKGGEGLPGPALWLNRDTPFYGGVYQVVSVTPGKGYHFQVDWAAVNYNGGAIPNDQGLVARQVGIDPYGGTNPLASTVQWSGEHRDGSKFKVPGLQLDQYARNNKLTVFLRAKSEFSGHVDVYFDHAILTENAGMGVITVAPPTATAAPATATRPAPTVARTRVALATSATATPPPPTVTLEPTSTETPRPLPTRTPRPTATPEETASASSPQVAVMVLIGLGGLGTVGVGLFVFGFMVFRLLGRR